MNAVLSRVSLSVALVLSGAALSAQEPKTPKEAPKGEPPAPGLTKSELEQIDELKVEALKRYMSQAHNSLNRDGLELLKARAILRSYQQKADAVVKLYADDAEVTATAKVFESPDVKKQLGQMLDTIKDEKAFAEAVGKYLKDQGASPAALRKYKDARVAREMFQKCDSGLKKIQAALDKPLPGLSPDSLNATGLQGLERVNAILARLDGKVPPPDATGAAPEDDLRELLKAVLK